MISYRKRKIVMKCLCDMYYKDLKNEINLEIVSSKTKLKIEELIRISANLESSELLEMTMLDKNYSAVEFGNLKIISEKKTPSAIVRLTDKGKCYFETKWDKVFEFLCKSVIVPIIITILTDTIKDSWQEIQELVRLYLNF